MEKIDVNQLMFEEEYLKDAIVVDSEGYVCGRVNGFTVEPDSIFINLYGYDEKVEEIPDEEELIKRLIGLIPKPFFRREASIEEFYTWARETLHLSNREPVMPAHLIELAEKKNLEVPYKTEEITTKVDKGSVRWSLVAKVGITDLGKCILLNEAVEAQKRGIAVNDKVSFKDTKEVAGAIVIDSDAKIVGLTQKFLVGDLPGLLINVEHVQKIEQYDVNAVTSSLIPSLYQDFDQLSKQVRKDLKLKEITDDDMVVWAKKNKINVPIKTIENIEILMELRMDWNKIAKIGDIVILREPIPNSNEEIFPTKLESNLPKTSPK